jgi:hypothetical protein
MADTDGLAAHVDSLSLALEQDNGAAQSSVIESQVSKDVFTKLGPREAHLATPPTRYGNLWSLYYTLDPAAIAPLEQAILHCRVRNYEQAQAIAGAFPPELKHHPVIAFEHSQSHWLGWQLQKCLNVLREAVAWAEARGGVDNGSGIYTLLRISLARVGVLVETDFTTARESLREIKRWLLNTPIDEYTDVKVRCQIDLLV